MTELRAINIFSGPSGIEMSQHFQGLFGPNFEGMWRKGLPLFQPFKILSKLLFKGVLHLWALFLKTLCIFSKNKGTSDKVSYGSGQKCSKELENYSFTSVETIVVKL